jgi:hypothetical protein
MLSKRVEFSNPGTRRKGSNIMLGERIGEASGKVTNVRAIPSDGPDTTLEISFQGTGNVLGRDIIDLGTYTQVVGEDGVFRGNGEVVMITAEGQSAH